MRSGGGEDRILSGAGKGLAGGPDDVQDVTVCALLAFSRQGGRMLHWIYG